MLESNGKKTKLFMFNLEVTTVAGKKRKNEIATAPRRKEKRFYELDKTILFA
jgi:hypothetical protein